MMTKSLLLSSILSLFMLISCAEEVAKKEDKNADLPLTETVDGVFTEYYPGRKAIKMQGQIDDKNQRHSKWTFFSETGTELSITHYEHGLKEGHSIVKYPNGVLNYYGEYKQDKKIGIWKKYDTKGKMIDETDFGQLK